MMAARFGRFAGLLFLTIAGLWFTVAVSAANVFHSREPARALRLAPFDAEARANLAWRLLERGGGRAVPNEAREHVKAALSRSPLSASAARTQGLIASVDRGDEAALKWFRYASRLSRRDLPTQLWLIEWNVRRGNVEGALDEFDRTLRSSRAARPLLFPVLASAADDQAIVGPLRHRLAAAPNWRDAFVQYVVEQAPNSEPIGRLARGLYDPRIPAERALLAKIIGRLAKDGHYPDAFAIYAAAKGEGRSGSVIRDGDFEGESEFAPLEWRYPEGGDIISERRAAPDGSGNALYIVSIAGAGGLAAEQLILLGSGNYVLSATVGETEGDALERPQIRIACAGRSDPLKELVFPATVGPMMVRGRFTVPSHDCPAQQLTILVRSSLSPPQRVPWIDSVAIRRDADAPPTARLLTKPAP